VDNIRSASSAALEWLYGRVDNIRSASSAALEWCKAMESEDFTSSQKLQLLRDAMQSQTDTMVQVSGKSVIC